MLDTEKKKCSACDKACYAIGDILQIAHQANGNKIRNHLSAVDFETKLWHDGFYITFDN
jgi:hypothetical protein